MKEKTLIGKSHIIPEFMYQDLYDENHKFYFFSPKEKFEGTGYTKRPSSGEYEGGLLCAECDGGIIGSYESYARLALEGGLSKNEKIEVLNYKNQHGVKGSLVKNINYKKFKLFLLSILWRASISSRPLFSAIALGPHEEILRKMIFEGNPETSTDYPIVFMTYVNDKDMPQDIIAQPKKLRNGNGNLLYAFIIGGFFYNFFVNSKQHNIPEFVHKETISPNDQMHIYHLTGKESWEILAGYFELNKSGS